VRSTLTTKRRFSIARAAGAKHVLVPVELGHAEAEVIGLANMRSLVDNYRDEYDLEMYINLDHNPSVEPAKAGIDAGFEFIHIDYSQANKDATGEEIVSATRAVVDYVARTTGALVESERHYFGGSSNLQDEKIDYDETRKTFSTPEGARAFVAGQASIHSRRRWGTCTAASRSPSSSTSTC
jgi:fructose-bisphosphate aldolase, class II